MNHSAEQVLLLAKSKQVEELEEISVNTNFVEAIGYLVHQLQIERGASSLYIASSGTQFNRQRAEIVATNIPLIAQFDLTLTTYLRLHQSANAKQLTLISWSLLGINQLSSIRQQVSTLGMAFMACMQAYTRLINSLISLLFEIIDNSEDSKVSKALATLYNLIIAKEAAGQERAIGAILIGSGKFNEPNHQRFIELIEMQTRHFELFNQLATADIVKAWQQHDASQLQKEHSQFRAMIIAASADKPLNPEVSDDWFDICTQRISIVWKIQCDLVKLISQQLSVLVANANLELEQVRERLSNSSEEAEHNTKMDFFDLTTSVEQPFLFFHENSTPPYQIKSISHLLHQQSQQIAEIENELSETKKALSERKIIERAKGLLMERLSINEVEAYKWMRKTAMDQNRKMVDLAENIIKQHRV